MLVFPNCKINLGLRILNKRADGFHNIETIFYPIPLKDGLEIVAAGNEEPDTFTSSGYPVNGKDADNLCLRAYQLLKKDFPLLPAVKIHLHKNIPMGAGLGGGSADAAFSLQLLNQQFQIDLSVTQLLNYALLLGSDCPFFILNKPCVGEGRGEILTPVALNLSGYNLVLVNPHIHVNTGEAFSALKLQPATERSTLSLQQLVTQPISTWQQHLINDFELPIFQKYPAIKAIKETMYEIGASYAAMSGSGSSVYGLFQQQLQPVINFDNDYFIRQLSLQ